MKKPKLWAALFAIFISGVLVGYFGAGIQSKHTYRRIFSGGPPAAREIIVKKLARELNLTDTQREHVDKVVCRMQAGLLGLRQQQQPEVRALINASIAEMKEVLDPEQRKKLDEHFEKVRKRWWGWRGHPPGKNWQNECP